jgi:sirohydrochlorin cobaltochelatase
VSISATAERPFRLPLDGVFTFGQVVVRPLPDSRFQLRHRDDADSAEPMQLFQDAEQAIEIARNDDDGNYRPLKTAPDLRHGWQLEVTGERDLARALEMFYPGRLAMLAARAANRLQTTSLRESLSRQTGMYRVAANIADSQLDCLIADFCRSDSGCLRTILWKRDANETIPSTKLPPEKFDPSYDQALTGGAEPIGVSNVPLLCQESCNLLIAECRKVVKGERSAF